MTTPRSKVWFHEYRPHGPRAAESKDLHERILNLWATGKTKREIADMLEIDPHTVRKVTWRARCEGDPRGFAKTQSILATSMSSHSVLEVYKEQWIIRGLARALEMPFAQIEAALRDVISEIESKSE